MNAMFPRKASTRRWWLIGTLAVTALGLALSWNWLAAVGLLVPLAFLLLFAPCMFMCVKGMGVSPQAGDSRSTHKPDAGAAPLPPQREPPSRGPSRNDVGERP